MSDDPEQAMVFPDAAAWREWLTGHHDSEAALWLVLSKKGGTETELDYPAALDEALCFGWIDGRVRSRDAGSFIQRFTPRTARSAWSERNVRYVQRLTDAGKMAPAGLAAVRAAQDDGRWQKAYAGPASAEVPADLAEAIADNPDAQSTFDSLTSQNRYALIYRLGTVKRQETRRRKIGQFVEMLARGETLHPQKRK
ncbi:YdeI/OmpD-associated family protein [Spelaeicoccus albus]|uniref:Uncharacterized protein YdeI (YjbR/CyaY-like superfamily) n=1 Tax=Spelaeicoccus albus TaxID=1280376 RepID=A0A7Z0D1G6_9MICO|nr:YdeI/OmpD-associated family protein [Spelaeicoccus albus]NYI66055.1 uncharacterized protein YdeI (YjbR/CyaY-like superfamily) [Spelaeicoccus albus]